MSVYLSLNHVWPKSRSLVESFHVVSFLYISNAHMLREETFILSLPDCIVVYTAHTE